MKQSGGLPKKEGRKTPQTPKRLHTGVSTGSEKTDPESREDVLAVQREKIDLQELEVELSICSLNPFQLMKVTEYVNKLLLVHKNQVKNMKILAARATTDWLTCKAAEAVRILEKELRQMIEQFLAYRDRQVAKSKLQGRTEEIIAKQELSITEMMSVLDGVYQINQ